MKRLLVYLMFLLLIGCTKIIEPPSNDIADENLPADEETLYK